MEWIIALIVMAVCIISFIKPKMIEKGYEQAKQEWDADQARYEAVIRKLPEDLTLDLTATILSL